MRDLTSIVTFVVLWTFLCRAERSWETENEDSISDLEELSKVLKAEQLYKSMDSIIQFDPEKTKCDQDPPPCPFITSTKCVPEGDDNFKCECLEGFELQKDKDPTSDKDACIKKENTKCDDTALCPNKQTTKCFNKDADDYECRCNDDYVLIPGKDAKTDLEACKKKENTKCDDTTLCPNKQTTKCFNKDTDDYECRCNDDYVLIPGKDAKTDPEACKKNENKKCDDTTLCPNKQSTKCFNKNEDDYECRCNDGYVLISGKDTKTDPEACKKLNRCERDSENKLCPSTQHKECVPNGADDYNCKCQNDYKLAKGKNLKTDSDACIKKTICDQQNDCPMDSTECKVKDGKENEYYCECLKGFDLQKDVQKLENKEACIMSCNPVICENGGKCDLKKKECVCQPPYLGKKCEKNTWCENNKFCSDRAKCLFDDHIKVGYCKCKDVKEVFNYAQTKCEGKLSCVEKKCENLKKCIGGECHCIAGYKEAEKTKKCVFTLCTNNGGCFAGSNCSESGLVGLKKCVCDNNKYYSDHQCKDASCLLPSLRSSCEQCPDGLTRQEGKCVQIGDDEKQISCGKACGNYGWCYKEGKTEKCRCIDGIAKADENGTACLLQQSVCPKGIKLTKEKNKCNCTGAFKLSSNGITCERRTCSDRDVQNECKKQNAICADNWESENGFTCNCPTGYDRNVKPSGECVDPCSLYNNIAECAKQNKACFLNKNGFECRCPPGLESKQDGSCGELDPTLKKSTYIITTLPVLSKNYKKSYGIDVIQLSKDIIDSMTVTFHKLDFAHLYTYKLNKDVIDCNVWLQFEKDAEYDYKRIKVQKITLTDPSIELLAPSLLLKKSQAKEIKENEFKICSDLNDDPFCEGAVCPEGTCKCKEGYEIIKNSVKKYNEKLIFTCKDINECKTGKHTCKSDNSECVNTDGSYFCHCDPGFKTVNQKEEINNKEPCIGACGNPNPCQNDGKCELNTNKAVNCNCKVGYSGSFCEKEDASLASAQQKTVVVGAVLGSILAILVILGVLYIIRRKKKNFYSEDFSPAPPQLQHAEMTERRPMRGVSNRGYE